MIAVIGAGVLGACVAHQLVRSGAEVLLVDAGAPGAATTSASLAWVNASAKVAHDRYFALNLAGLREHERLAADWGGGPWWNQTGHLRWDYPREHELLRHVARLQALGYRAEAVPVEHASELEPQVVFGAAAPVVAHLPAEGWVDGPAMVKALVAAAVAEGAATAFGAAVARIEVRRGRVRRIELSNGTEHLTGAVVNAAGAAAADVAALVGRRLPMRRSAGLVVRVSAPPRLVGRVLHPPEVALRPDGQERVLLSARAVDPELEAGHVGLSELAQRVVSSACATVPALAGAEVLDARVGLRPLPADGFPSVGALEGIAGYYEAVTHSGVTLGPLVGRLLAAEILQGQVDPLLASFRPGRLEGAVSSAEETG